MGHMECFAMQGCAQASAVGVQAAAKKGEAFGLVTGSPKAIQVVDHLPGQRRRDVR